MLEFPALRIFLKGLVKEIATHDCLSQDIESGSCLGVGIATKLLYVF